MPALRTCALRPGGNCVKRLPRRTAAALRCLTIAASWLISARRDGNCGALRYSSSPASRSSGASDGHRDYASAVILAELPGCRAAGVEEGNATAEKLGLPFRFQEGSELDVGTPVAWGDSP